MGTEAAWIPAVIAAVGAGASAKNTYDTAKRTDNEAAAGIAAQAQKQRQADSRVNQEVQQLQASSPEQERANATNQFMDQLRRTRGEQYDTGSAGATSGAFKTDTANAATNVADFGKTQADQLARISAPSRQRSNEQISFGRLGSDLGGIGRAANGDAFLSQLRLRGIQRNPWVDAGAGVAQGVAGGMAQTGGAGDGTLTNTLDNGYTFQTKIPKVRY